MALDLSRGKQKRVLAVDDSLTVRELVRKLLASRGYLADVAVDGMDGWNAVRAGHYDLVITDVDMPRLDGIELATLIKKDPRLKSLPGDDRLLQGPRGRPLARAGSGRGLLPDQGQLSRRNAAAGGRGFDWRARRMRIALVNDVLIAVEAMRRVVLSTREHQVAWIAHDGAEALELCARDTPDLILMDLIMPRMDGVEATRRIMARNPCAIVVVTANVTHQSSKVFEAMGAGALDAVNTPVLERPGHVQGGQALLAKIETIRRLIGAARRDPPASRPRPAGRAASRPAPQPPGRPSAPPPAGPRHWPKCWPICRPDFPPPW